MKAEGLAYLMDCPKVVGLGLLMEHEMEADLGFEMASCSAGRCAFHGL